MNAPAGAQVTPGNVEAYVAELKNRVSSVTVYSSIQKLRRFVQLIAPRGDLGWLIEIERQLYSERRPRSKWHRVVTTDVLVDAGRTLMAEAEIARRPALTRARMYRNGLMIALLAYCPIRLKNYAALEIGRSFVNVDVDCTHGGRNKGKKGGRATRPRRPHKLNRALSADLPTNPGERHGRDKRSLVGNGR
jgi:hypothetical protein